MNIVLILSNPVNLEPFYVNPVPIELLKTELGTLFEKNYSVWKNNFPDSSIYVIDGCMKPVFTELCGNSDTLNIPADSIFAKVFFFTAFSSSYSFSPLTIFAPANHDIESLNKIISKVLDYLSTPLSSESFTFFSPSDGHSQVCIETGDSIFRGGRTEILTIKKFISLASTVEWKEKHPDSKISPFLNGISIFTMNSSIFKNFLSLSSPDLYSLFLLLEKYWKDMTTLKKELPQIIRKLNPLKLEEAISSMEDKFAVAVDGMIDEINAPSKLLKTLPKDSNGNYIEGPVSTDDVVNSLVMNKGPLKICLKNLRNKMVLSSKKGVRVESL